MTSQRRFAQVDVFTHEPYRGNPVAVILDADGVSDDEMARIANWTNLSETTFVLAPTSPEADYRVRIFTPVMELPFAGHPTLGTCHAWLQAGGSPRDGERVVQECAAGLIPIRRSDAGLAFAAPPLVRSGPVDDADAALLRDALGLSEDEVLAIEWVDNGPGWVAVLVESAARVLTVPLVPAPAPHLSDIGLVGFQPEGSDSAVEVRAFFRGSSGPAEDPVTGSLNASVAQWLLGSGQIEAPYTAVQGTALGRAGRVRIDEADGEIWVGGGTVTCVEGTISA